MIVSVRKFEVVSFKADYVIILNNACLSFALKRVDQARVAAFAIFPISLEFLCVIALYIVQVMMLCFRPFFCVWTCWCVGSSDWRVCWCPLLWHSSQSCCLGGTTEFWKRGALSLLKLTAMTTPWWHPKSLVCYVGVQKVSIQRVLVR